MDEIIKRVYKCYLGKNMIYRTASIMNMLENNNESFFYIYGTNTDSILDFIKRGKRKELNIFNRSRVL